MSQLRFASAPVGLIRDARTGGYPMEPMIDYVICGMAILAMRAAPPRVQKRTAKMAVPRNGLANQFASSLSNSFAW